MSKTWALSKRADLMKSSIIRELLKLTQKPGIISFAGGLPADDLFPVLDIKNAAERMLVKHGKKALQYGTTEGHAKLREFIANWMKQRGIPADPNLLLITSGSQQGLDLCGRVFLDIDDAVLTSKPTYLGAIQAFNAYHPKYVTLPSDDCGMVLDGIEEIIEQHNPKFIYQVPTFQNPDGRTVPIERRRKLIDIAEKYNIPIIEDDPYSALCYKGDTPMSLKSIAPEQVILLGTFSKMISPGLRVAWVLAPEKIYDKFVKMKQGTDLHTSTLTQYLIYEYVKDGSMDSHLERIKEHYGTNMAVMKKAIEKHFPKEAKVTNPTGGMFYWVELPEEINCSELLEKAIKHDVAFVPGSAFFPDGTGHNTMRLNFSKPSKEEISEGIKRLGDVIREELAICGCKS